MPSWTEMQRVQKNFPHITKRFILKIYFGTISPPLPLSAAPSNLCHQITTSYKRTCSDSDGMSDARSMGDRGLVAGGGTLSLTARTGGGSSTSHGGSASAKPLPQPTRPTKKTISGTTRAVPEIQGCEILRKFASESVEDFRWQIICQFSRGK